MQLAFSYINLEFPGKGSESFQYVFGAATEFNIILHAICCETLSNKTKTFLRIEMERNVSWSMCCAEASPVPRKCITDCRTRFCCLTDDAENQLKVLLKRIANVF